MFVIGRFHELSCLSGPDEPYFLVLHEVTGEPSLLWLNDVEVFVYPKTDPRNASGSSCSKSN